MTATPSSTYPGPQLAEMAALDPCDAWGRGAGTALATSRTTGLQTDPLTSLGEAILRAGAQRLEVPAVVASPWRRHGIDTGPPQAGQAPAELTPTEREWLGALPARPADVAAEDVTLLRQLAGRFSPATVEGRLVASKADPVRRHHDRVAEASRLEREMALHRPIDRQSPAQRAIQGAAEALIAGQLERSAALAPLTPAQRRTLAAEEARGLVADARVAEDNRRRATHRAATARLAEIVAEDPSLARHVAKARS